MGILPWDELHWAPAASKARSDANRPHGADVADGELVKCARGGVHLIVVPAVGEAAQFVEERGVPRASHDLDVP